MAELLEDLSVIAFVVAGVCLLLAVFLWFRFRILSVMNDLSGKTAKRAIAQIRENNQKAGSNAHRSGTVNRNHGSLAMPMPDATAKSTEKLPEDRSGQPVPETTLFQEAGKTVILFDRSDGSGTTVLQDRAENTAQADEKPKVSLTILDSIVLIHTDEVIP